MGRRKNVPILRPSTFGRGSDSTAMDTEMKHTLPTRVPAPLPLCLILHASTFGRGSDSTAMRAEMKHTLPTRVPGAWGSQTLLMG